MSWYKLKETEKSGEIWALWAETMLSVWGGAAEPRPLQVSSSSIHMLVLHSLTFMHFHSLTLFLPYCVFTILLLRNFCTESYIFTCFYLKLMFYISISLILSPYLTLSFTLSLSLSLSLGKKGIIFWKWTSSQRFHPAHIILRWTKLSPFLTKNVKRL